MLAFLFLLLSVAVIHASGAAQDETPLYSCESGADYETFEADSDLVDQVCPAHNTNYSSSGMTTSGSLYIVIHNTGNYSDTSVLGNIRKFQTSHDLDSEKASAHYIVGLSLDREEVHVIQLVREGYRAYHVGIAHPLDGVTIDNTNSIGIEVVGQGDYPGWPSDDVYRKTAELVLDIVGRAKASGRTIELTRDYIVGHEEVNKTGKWDPGQRWNWQVFMEDYLERAYEPAMNLTATLDTISRKVTLQVTARDNGRTKLRVERNRGSGPYSEILDPMEDSGDDHKENPATVRFHQVDILPEPQTPWRYCYRMWAFKPHTRDADTNVDYVNPSTEACVNLGLADADVIRQTEDLVVGPSDPIAFTVVLKNVGDLTWGRDGQYGLIKLQGKNDGLPRWVKIEDAVPPGQSIEFNFTGTAPSSIEQYWTVWRITYINPDTGKAEAFGPLVIFGVTVFPLGNIVDDPGVALRLLWEKLRRSIEDWVDRWLADLGARVGEALRGALYALFPWLRCLSGLSLGTVVPLGLAVRRRRNRRP
jgi:N-acetyl-anhydromuramyl-L-alanine amidase AmpD